MRDSSVVPRRVFVEDYSFKQTLCILCLLLDVAYWVDIVPLNITYYSRNMLVEEIKVASLTEGLHQTCYFCFSFCFLVCNG